MVNLASYKLKSKEKAKKKNILAANGYPSPNFSILSDINNPKYEIEFIYSLNYSNYVFTEEEKVSFSREYIRNSSIHKDILSKIDPHYLISLGTLCWLVSLDVNKENLTDRIEKELSYLHSKVKTSNDNISIVQQNTQIDKKQYITNFIIEQLEGMIDDVYLISEKKIEKKELPNPRDIFSNSQPFYLDKVKHHFSRQFEDLKLLPTVEDLVDDLKNNNFIKKSQTVLSVILSQIEEFEKEQTAKQSKPKPIRLKKPKKIIPTKMAKSVKYLKEFDDGNGLVLKSESPVKIVTADAVWIYNTKINRMSHYQAKDGVGILIKGTTLQNFDPEKSFDKRLKNPKDFIDKLIKTGKVEQRKLLDSQKGKSKTPNGRINDKCIIVKIY